MWRHGISDYANLLAEFCEKNIFKIITWLNETTNV